MMLRNKSVNMLLKFKSLGTLAANTRGISDQPLFGDGNNFSKGTAASVSLSLEEKMKAMFLQQTFEGNKKISIYRVPDKLRKVEPGSYDPQFISIGPYHHASLLASHKLKWLSLKRLLGSGREFDRELSHLVAVLRHLENEARESYSDDVLVGKDEFIEMMLLDGCFIIQLFRELYANNFAFSSLLSKRWMLPVVRRDLITLENQIPMVILKKLFEETSRSSTSEPSLEELALRFFDPLMPRAPKVLEKSTESIAGKGHKHLLHLFHSSISLGDANRNKEPHMYMSMAQLRETGIKVRVLEECQPLELKFVKGVLRIPCLQIDDHTGSFLRNVVAYEQCHQDCKPDMTCYLFFLDKLINSAEDVGVLHYEGVIQHTLGSNKQVAKLVNKLCTEVEHDGYDSYLFRVVESINTYTSNPFVKTRARLKHDYFTNLWVGISTVAALLLLYLTLLQASCDAIEAKDKKYGEMGGWWGTLNMLLVNPSEGLTHACNSASIFIVDSIFNTHIQDLPPFSFSP